MITDQGEIYAGTSVKVISVGKEGEVIMIDAAKKRALVKLKDYTQLYFALKELSPIMQWKPVTKVNDYIYTGAIVKIKRSNKIGQVEDMFRRKDDKGNYHYRIQVKLRGEKFTTRFEPDQLKKP